MIQYSEEEQKFINTVDGGIATHEEIKDYYDGLFASVSTAQEQLKEDRECKPDYWDSCRVEKMGCGRLLL